MGKVKETWKFWASIEREEERKKRGEGNAVDVNEGDNSRKDKREEGKGNRIAKGKETRNIGEKDKDRILEKPRKNKRGLEKT